MGKTKFKDPKDIRDKTVHINFSENEITKIDEYVGKNNTTRTAFIRDAIWRKIALTQKPEASNSQFSDSTGNLIFESLEEIKKEIKRFNIVKELEGIHSTLRTLESESNIKKNMIIVDEILKKHDGKLKMTKLMIETGLSGSLSGIIAYYPEKYKFNSKTSEVELNE